MIFNNVLEAIGGTPLVRLNKVACGVKARLYGKLEFLNPGGSMKDRIAVSMIAEAERKGFLKPGWTIIEGSSGNTAVGLAVAAAVKGYKLIITIQDKQSREKISTLKALGAEVIICPTAVAPEDPRSYYSVARKLNKEIPNSYYINQYDNPDNPLAHERTTGPEIWEESGGAVTHFVAGIGTGGTITGVGRFLKSQRKDVRIVGVDPVGSILHDYFRTGKITEAQPYKIEGIGEDIIPRALDFSVVDDVVQVTDKESFLMARRLAREEGIFAGGTAGSTLAGALKAAQGLDESAMVVVLIADTGTRALSKLYNDEWMEENRFLDSTSSICAEDVVRWKERIKELVCVKPSDGVMDALRRMQELEISQLPVMEEGKPVGAVVEDDILKMVLQGRELKGSIVREVMGEPFPIVDRSASIDQLTALIRTKAPAVMVDMGGRHEVITKYDLVHSIPKIAEGKR